MPLAETMAAGREGMGVVIDTDHLEHATAGDRALQAELLQLFRDQLAATSALIEDGDIGDNLHRLKGASYAVGAKPLAAAIVKAEAALRGGAEAGSLNRTVPQLRIAIRDARTAVDALLAAPPPGGLANAGETG